jgi:tetratricopeptide (TPR) repeat protein
LAEKAQHQAEANFAKARAAVDESLTRISESQLLTVPGMQPVRRELLSSALRFYEDFVAEHRDDPTVQAGLASAFLRVGKIRRELGESRAATESFEKARTLFDRLVQAKPSEPELSHGMAEAFLWLGRHDEAIAIWQHLVGSGQTRFQHDLADAYNSAAISEFYEGGSQLDTIETYYSIRETLVPLNSDEKLEPARRLEMLEKSFLIRDMLVTFNPDDPIARRDLGGSLNNLGVSLRNMGQREQALALFRRAVEEVEKALAQSPHDWRNGKYLSISLSNCAHVEYDLGRLNESWRWHRREIEFRQKIAQDNPSTPALRSDVVQAYKWLIYRLREHGLHDELMKTIRQAREWTERLPRHGAEALFDLARARASCSNWLGYRVTSPTSEERDAQVREADLAMDALRQAVAAGFADLNRLDKAPELNPLRSRSDFKALVSKLRSTTSRSNTTDVSKVMPGPSKAGPREQGSASPILSARSQEDEALARHATGLTLLSLGKLDDAAEHLEKAMAIRRQLVTHDPTRLEYQFDLAATMAGLAEHEQKMGRAERAREWWERALPMLSRATEHSPNDRLTWQLLGLAHAGLRQPEEAASAFARIMELVPQANYQGLWWFPDPAAIGEVLAPYDEIFARVVQMRPTDRTLLIARCHYFGRRRRWREAADIVARIIELDPKDDLARFYRRILQYHLGDFDGYRREPVGDSGVNSIERTADEIIPLIWRPSVAGKMATEAYREGRYAEAVRYYKDVINVMRHPFTLTLTHLQLAKAHRKLAQSAEARKELEVARKQVSRLGRGSGAVAGMGLVSGETGLMDYGWTEWLFARIVLDEADALIVYDPIFPADPFAR